MPKSIALAAGCIPTYTASVTGPAAGQGIPLKLYKVKPHFDFSMAKNVAIEPLADRVVVRPASTEEVSASGIIIPDSVSKEKPERGTVVAVGPGKYDDGDLIPMSVKKGDLVLFSKYGYDEVKIEGEEYFILPESSVLAIIPKSK